MKRCIKCTGRIRWDWENGHFMIGDDHDTVPSKVEKASNNTVEMQTHYCTCGVKLAVTVTDDEGSTHFLASWMQDFDFEHESY